MVAVFHKEKLGIQALDHLIPSSFDADNLSRHTVDQYFYPEGMWLPISANGPDIRAIIQGEYPEALAIAMGKAESEVDQTTLFFDRKTAHLSLIHLEGFSSSGDPYLHYASLPTTPAASWVINRTASHRAGVVVGLEIHGDSLNRLGPYLVNGCLGQCTKLHWFTIPDLLLKLQYMFPMTAE